MPSGDGLECPLDPDYSLDELSLLMPLSSGVQDEGDKFGDHQSDFTFCPDIRSEATETKSAENQPSDEDSSEPCDSPVKSISARTRQAAKLANSKSETE